LKKREGPEHLQIVKEGEHGKLVENLPKVLTSVGPWGSKQQRDAEWKGALTKNENCAGPGETQSVEKKGGKNGNQNFGTSRQGDRIAVKQRPHIVPMEGKPNTKMKTCRVGEKNTKGIQKVENEDESLGLKNLYKAARGRQKRRKKKVKRSKSRSLKITQKERLDLAGKAPKDQKVTTEGMGAQGVLKPTGKTLKSRKKAEKRLSQKEGHPGLVSVISAKKNPAFCVGKPKTPDEGRIPSPIGGKKSIHERSRSLEKKRKEVSCLGCWGTFHWANEKKVWTRGGRLKKQEKTSKKTHEVSN